MAVLSLQVEWHMTATISVTVALGALAVTYHGLSLDKRLTIVGLDNLPSVRLDVFEASIAHATDQVRLDLTVEAFNPSIVAIDPLVRAPPLCACLYCRRSR